MSSTPTRFRYTFLPVWRLQTTVTTAGVFTTMFVFALATGHPIERPTLVMSASISFFCALFLGAVTALVRFTVSAVGLRTFNTFGSWKVIPWDQISRADPAKYYFLPHLRLTVDHHATKYWIPLFLEDMHGFRAAVLQATDEFNPVYRALPVPASSAARITPSAARPPGTP